MPVPPLKSPNFQKTLNTTASKSPAMVSADRKAKRTMQGSSTLGAGVGKQNTNHGKLDLPFTSLNKYAGHKEGGIMKSADKGKKLPSWMMKKDAGGKAPPFGKKTAKFAKGGGIEVRGKTKGKMC